MEDKDNENPRKTWNLMIGVSFVLLGSLQLYNRVQQEGQWSVKSITIIVFILFGVYLIFKHFQNSTKD